MSTNISKDVLDLRHMLMEKGSPVKFNQNLQKKLLMTVNMVSK